MKYYCNHGQTPYEAYHTSYIPGGEKWKREYNLKKENIVL